MRTSEPIGHCMYCRSTNRLYFADRLKVATWFFLLHRIASCVAFESPKSTRNGAAVEGKKNQITLPCVICISEKLCFPKRITQSKNTGSLHWAEPSWLSISVAKTLIRGQDEPSISVVFFTCTQAILWLSRAGRYSRKLGISWNVRVLLCFAVDQHHSLSRDS